MTTNRPAAIVQRMFSAFEDRNLEKLLATVHPDSHWTYVGAPIPAQPKAPMSEETMSGDSLREFL
jgi:ketosteroid isomerase-like protein